jgi:hypothetical protein
MAVLRRTGSSKLSAPKDALRISTQSGALSYWEITSKIYATEVTGHMTPEMARLIIERGEQLYLSTGTVSGFHNWLQMTGYDPACRIELTAWVLRHKPASVVHIGVTSRLVAMGVTVANLALGNLIKVHATLAALEADLAVLMR